jgi:hypothetical protein
MRDFRSICVVAEGAPSLAIDKNDIQHWLHCLLQTNDPDPRCSPILA